VLGTLPLEFHKTRALLNFAWRSPRLAVAQSIVQAYSAAHEAVFQFEPLRPIHEFCQSYDPAHFKVRASLWKWGSSACLIKEG